MAAQHDRQRLIRLIHVAKRDLALDDETYRAILRRIANKDSSAALSIPELEKVLSYLKQSGFKVRQKPQGRRKPLPQDDRDTSKKIRALWLFLHALGAVKDPSEAALFAYVRRITKVDALQWIDGEHSHQVIETLKRWAQRHLPGALRTLAAQIRDSDIEEHARQRAQAALFTASTRGSFDAMRAAYEICQEALRHGSKEVT
ncbi:gp16 family protein [Acinetobacter baumannii]